jgi:hypothetical protein
MTDTQTGAPAAAPAPLHPATPADQLLTVGIVLLGQNLHLPLSGAQLNSGAAAIVTLAGLAYGVIASNPSRISPLTWLLHVLQGGNAAQRKTWDAAVAALKARLLPEVEAAIDARIRAQAGLFAAPADAIANAAIKAGAETAEKALLLPQS